MLRTFPAILFTFLAFTLLAIQTADITKPAPLQASLEGNSLAVTTTPTDNVTFTHAFPFTDKRMKMNQVQFEQYIEDLIISDLEKSENVTQASEKYPLNSPVYLNIDTKYAYHALIEESGIRLFTFKYDLTLSSCGPSVRNLIVLGSQYSAGDLFNTQTILNRKYRNIIESLIRALREEKKVHFLEQEKQYKEQEIPLFITVHPELAFVSAAIVEDRLENLRVNFPELNVRYCAACTNILPYDEYAYLSWMTISNNEAPKEDNFFRPLEQNLINIGFGPKAIFVAYPDEVSLQSNEDDKLSTHAYCLNNKREVNAFVQNAYYARSLEQFASNFIMFTAKTISDKSNSQSSEEVKVELACYPKHYNEKIDVYSFTGTGNFTKCNEEIENYIKLNYVPSEANRNFGLPQDKMPWPLESLKGSVDMGSDIKVYIESADLENLFQMSGLDSKYKSITLEGLYKQIKSSCTELLDQEVSDNLRDHAKKDYLERCMHFIYIYTLLNQTGMKKEKTIYIRNSAGNAESWMKGLTIKHIETFHRLEKDWFDAVQDRALEGYLLKLKAAQDLEVQRSMYMTFGLLVMLAMTFWIGFIVRFRNIDANEPAKVIKHK